MLFKMIDDGLTEVSLRAADNWGMSSAFPAVFLLLGHASIVIVTKS